MSSHSHGAQKLELLCLANNLKPKNVTTKKRKCMLASEWAGQLCRRLDRSVKAKSDKPNFIEIIRK